MNGAMKWVGTMMLILGMIAGYALLVADRSYFSLAKGVAVAGSLERTLKIIDKLEKKQEKQEHFQQNWEQERLKDKIKRLEEEKRKLQQRPVAR